jgi:hypothetical protein
MLKKALQNLIKIENKQKDLRYMNFNNSIRI